VHAPSDDTLRRAQVTLRSLVSDDAPNLPSLSAIADAIRLELDAHGKVAILYVRLNRYGNLERIYGWRIVSDILDAVARNLGDMVGSTLRRLDVVADFTLSDNAFVVLLSPPRSRDVITSDDLAAVTRRVYERLQSTLLNDLAPGVYDRVHPSVGATIMSADASLTFEQNLQRGVAFAMQAAEQQAAVYDDELEKMLSDTIDRHEFESLFEPVVDMARRTVVGYRTSARGPFYSPLRLPDVLVDVARRSPLAYAFGDEVRRAAVAAAMGLQANDLLFCECGADELPNAAVVAVSEFYSLNTALVPQHVVFEVAAAHLTVNTASTLRTLANVREMGFQICVSELGGQLTSLELVGEARPDFLCLAPELVAGVVGDMTTIDAVQMLVRFADRLGSGLIAPEVNTIDEARTLRRVGASLLCGELAARPDTRLPKVSWQRLDGRESS
jgi:EAL domain-containing protein (putative c-di-GMP-specific phosphodiesterase class I)